MNQYQYQQHLNSMPGANIKPPKNKPGWGSPFNGEPRTRAERETREWYDKKFREALEEYEKTDMSKPFFFMGRRYL